MIVMKFGGTSVESAAAMNRVADIVIARAVSGAVVVVSAMGKTTNRLLHMAGVAVGGARETSLALAEELRQMHLEETPESVHEAIGSHFDELVELLKSLSVLGEFTPRTVDLISSYGERLSSLAFAAVLRQRGVPAVHIDAREMIVTDSRHTLAAPNFAETNARLDAVVRPLAEAGVVVMGGFIAATAEGVTSTLGRGGSDYTAAIVGAGVGASEIQIWTDVDGMLTADPRVIPGGHRILVCSFAEASELAYFGAKVLHPATVLPAIEQDIPVRILNSRNPASSGTLIVSDAPPSSNVAKSIACKRQVTVVNVTSGRMFLAYGFLRKIFEIFDRFETPVDMVSTSEVSVSLTIDNAARLDQIVEALGEFSSVSVEQNQAIVCIVGENIRHTPGVAARAFGAVADINIRMISQGASRLNLGFVVAEADLTPSIQALHREFFSEVDPATFGD